MRSPLVSVIIPTFDRADFVVEAVDSVLGQTYSRWECIVIDDGSTDDTVQRLQMFEDSRIRVLSRTNRGVSAARNAGIAVSSGDVIALLDSDDYWLPEKLTRHVAHMLANGHHISQTEEIWYRGGRRVNQKRKHAKPEGVFFRESLKMCLVSPSCVMFSREFWNDVGPFDEEMPACEDYDLWLRAWEYPVGLLREALTVKRGGRPDQLSNAVPCLDIYRMRAIVKMLQSGKIDGEDRRAALDELRRKAEIYVQGAEKRGKKHEADRVWNLICKALEGKEIPLNSLR
ncbi:glycosyltransferase family 2 protein [Pseudodesulfovibrio tunisiensis]|uniref:glycosyltransferase family 2 protein n=1 Tax=Pseudodesulfovibrio tunisiensis TaxID=463192 RepID=UPI001FB4E76D|nr:glycosyltransferase [Pseudodesulfovibrio tunisiensis]